MATTVASARANLYAALQTSFAGEPNVQLTYGPPGAHEEPEVVALMGVSPPSAKWAALGNQSRDELYGLKVAIKVFDPDAGENDVPAVDARAWQLYDLVVAAVLADVSLGGAVLTALPDQAETDGVLPGVRAGWGCYIEVTVSCRARIN